MLISQLVVVAGSIECQHEGYRVAESVVVVDLCGMVREREVKSAVGTASLLYHPSSALSVSGSFFFEKKETWLLTA